MIRHKFVCAEVIFVDGVSWSSQKDERDIECSIRYDDSIVEILYRLKGEHVKSFVPISSIVRFEDIKNADGY